jgi:ABC-type Na+ transport system ATPase subunit NatA
MIEIKNLGLTKKIPEISALNLQIRGGETYVLLSSRITTIDHLINIFTCVERDFSGEVLSDDINIRSGCKNMVILNTGRDWPPDIKIGALISFFKRNIDVSDEEFEEFYIELDIDRIYCRKISEIDEVEWRRILFSLTRLIKCKNYILHDFAGGMPLDFNLEFRKILSRMKEEDCSILYLSDDVFLAPEIGDRVGFMRKGKLLLELTASKMRKMDLKDLYFQFLSEQ